MKRILVAIGMLAAFGASPAWAQSTDECVPSTLNIPEAKYPCVYPDHRALFRVVAPDADGEVPDRRLAVLADAQLGEHASHLLAQRPVADVGEIADRRVETHPGFDDQRELVDEVRQLRVDLLGAPRCRLAEQETRDEDAGRREDDAEQEPPGTVGDEKAEQQPDGCERDAQRHEELGRQTA